jgi:hypothetical protein
MRAFGDELREPRLGFRRRIRARDAERIEAAGARLVGERRLDLLRIVQKSRSA